MSDKWLVEDEAGLESVIGQPIEFVRGKVLTQLNEAMKEFIRRSPLLFVSTIDANGAPDVSPKGDPEGFVEIDASGNLLIPERPGNRLAALDCRWKCWKTALYPRLYRPPFTPSARRMALRWQRPRRPFRSPTRS